MEQIIEIKNLTFRYEDNIILNNISFSVNKGEFLGIVGANGCGKSTLLKLMLNIMKPLSGSITLFGEKSSSFKGWNKIGYISQKATSFNNSFPATVEEVVQANMFSKIGLFRFTSKEHKQKVAEVLEKVGMQDFAKRLIGNLSGGQQQRVFIARALVNDPEILILDEPTTGIDFKSENDLYCLLSELNKNYDITIMMVTHDIESILVHAGCLVLLGNNKTIKFDSIDDINQEILKELSGYKLNLTPHICKNCNRKVEAL